jgi:hypothetical protein
LKYGGADFLQNPRIFSLQNGPRMRASTTLILTFLALCTQHLIGTFNTLFIKDFCKLLLFSVVEQELHHFGGVGAKALSRYGSDSNGSGYRLHVHSGKLSK